MIQIRQRYQIYSEIIPSGNLTKLLKMTHLVRWFSYWRWWFSIAMLVYQRIYLCVYTYIIIPKSIEYEMFKHIPILVGIMLTCPCPIYYRMTMNTYIYTYILDKFHSQTWNKAPYLPLAAICRNKGPACVCVFPGSVWCYSQCIST